MIKIRITQGKEALIDDEDFELVSKYKWYCVTPVGSKTLNYAGAKTRGKQNTVLMHRLIINAPQGTCVDHIDRNGLNNVRSNLRLCTKAENSCNSKLHSTNTSGFRGVAFHTYTGKFRAYVSKNDRQVHVGLYDTAKEAAIARNAKAIEYYGKFAVLNEVENCTS